MLNGNKVLLGIKLIKFSPLMKMGVIKGENFDLNELKIKEVEGTMRVPGHFAFLWLCWPSRMHIYCSVGPFKYRDIHYNIG